MEGVASIVGAFQHPLIFLLLPVAYANGREAGQGAKILSRVSSLENVLEMTEVMVMLPRKRHCPLKNNGKQ